MGRVSNICLQHLSRLLPQHAPQMWMQHRCSVLLSCIPVLVEESLWANGSFNSQVMGLNLLALALCSKNTTFSEPCLPQSETKLQSSGIDDITQPSGHQLNFLAQEIVINAPKELPVRKFEHV